MVDSIATSALVIALVALITALGQLLQQYFATADGYRRCQASVMGHWAKKTRIRFRWSEFRLETTFVVPRIVYKYHLQAPIGATVDGNCLLTNTCESLEASMTAKGWYNETGRLFYESDQLACWVPLLAQLHSQGAEAMLEFRGQPLGGCKMIGLPAVQFIHKSWDFMPPDIIRPMATSTISAIAIMGIRLGMTWKTFDPAESLRAEGNGHMFTSTVARSFGIIVQYAFTSRKKASNLTYTPVIEADKMAFGRVALDSQLFGMLGPVFDLEIGSYQGLARSLPKLFFFPVYGTRKQFTKNLAAYWMDRLPSPISYPRGVTASYEGLLVFSTEVKRMILARGEQECGQLSVVNSLLQKLNTPAYAEVWNRGQDSQKHALPVEHELRLLLIESHSRLTAFLQKTKVLYNRLACQHLYAATQESLKDRTEELNRQSISPEISSAGMDSIEINRTHFHTMLRYIDYVMPDVVKNVMLLTNNKASQHATTVTSIEVEDAWVSMMLRAFCWQRCHHLMEDFEPLPSEYWDSKMPVYIG
ncbi:hypothetical protein GLAREA_04854 [Glarea lozoyensis ATCC 20868]|uniref:Modin n=1 Tax=Glarea lozoyensis (strain ATCC 20868 / MF5171) TaxID=1116229 RepID=S3DNL0_GLAL2|nr:uncharacterized protein GLAREA_04854 [Glarea lozoyensis ATCC 20868]EPE28063.1 hypothetical protein GLAREA_04854 [Glarea lozoyensis ATCC 20868]